jgi:putative ABC transport system permease protein
MWRNYMTVGLRALAKNKVYAFINIFGLSLGIAACLLILTFVRYEFSYDSWMPGAGDAYQLQDFYKPTEQGGEEMKLQVTSYTSGIALQKDFPQIEKRVYVTGQGITFLLNGQAYSPEHAVFTDGNIFDILQVPFVRGDRAHALDDPNALVLSESEAKKYFGSENPLGRTITLMSGDLKDDYRVTGVYKDLPKNTHLGIGAVARFSPQTYFARNPTFLTSWNSQGGYVYVKLRPGTDVGALKRSSPRGRSATSPMTRPMAARSPIPATARTSASPTSATSISATRSMPAQTPGSDKQTILTFAIVALMILGMACINFTNLATARASQRAREVALRKVLGATRRQLVVQFIGESILVAAIATLVALALAELALRPLNGFLDAEMQIRYLGSGRASCFR